MIVCTIEPITAAMVEHWLRRKYVVHADARQKKMGLDYVTAETSDLARELAHSVNRYILSEISEMSSTVTKDFEDDMLAFDL